MPLQALKIWCTQKCMFFKICSIKFLPILTFIWFILTIFIVYAVAVANKHVRPIWPCISFMSKIQPESGIFGLLLSINSLFMGLVQYYKYKQIRIFKLLRREKDIRWLNCFNIFVISCGIIADIAACLVANFQLSHNQFSKIVHAVGANMAFVFGLVYIILQTILCSILNEGDKIGRILNIIRGVVCGIDVLSFILYVVFTNEYRKANPLLKTSSRSTTLFPNNTCPTDLSDIFINEQNSTVYKKNYIVIACISQWVVAICLYGYILTFIYDFKYLKKPTTQETNVEVTN